MTPQISGANVARFAPHALALLRIVTAVLFLAHGLVKLVGFPAGAAPGEQPVMTLLWLAGVIEVVTGTLLFLGLFTRPAALIACGEMAVA
jgi:putative oxidoreductase